MTSESTCKHITARTEFDRAVEDARIELIANLRQRFPHIHEGARLRGLLRLARTAPVSTDALRTFEAAVRGPLRRHLETTPRHLCRYLHPDAAILREHFVTHSVLPLSHSPVYRVVSCARRLYRKWRKDTDP